MEITLKEILVGTCHTVVTLSLENDDRAEAFLEQLIKSNQTAAKSLQTCMATITAIEDYRNPRKFKTVAAHIHEIKVKGIRLYCFRDQLDATEGIPSKLIIATNGGKKNTAKEQTSDIKRAEQIRERYLAAKLDPDTELNYQPLPQPNEN